MYRQILLSILFSIAAGHIMAQQSLSVAANTISSSNIGKGTFYYANRNDPPRAIEFKERTVTASNFLANINQYFGIPVEFTFVEVESNTDDLGMRHRLLQQYYGGVPLEGLGYRVHEKNGFVTSANGRAVRDIKLEAHTAISEETAFQLAIKYLNATDTVSRHGKKLIVSKGFTFTPESFSISFQFDISVSFLEQWRISIDAHNGALINKVSLANSCKNEVPPPLPYDTGTGLSNYYGIRTIQVEKYQGGASRLIGRTPSGGMIGTYDFQNVSGLSLTWFFEFHKVYDFYSSNNTYNDPYHKPAVSVQWAAEQAYEYYFRKHNRISFDNQGSAIKCYVHVDKNWNNAMWIHNLLAFGDGNNNNPLVELDVVAHELTHGVTQYEAGLQYYNESGALNESFSDIFGKAVEFDVFGDTATWQLAKYNRDGGLRDLSNPNVKNQPDTYAGDMWHTTSDDNGGVHVNSGVQNFWFYLLCKGGSGINDQRISYSVNSIGMDAAVKIAYRNLTEYLSNYSDYLDSRIGSLLATADLYGKSSTIYQEVDKAWDAVGVIDEPIIKSLEVYDITATTVKLKGSLLPRGDTVRYHFEYGTTPAFGSSSVVYSYTNSVNGMVTGLQSETKYHLRLVATNENGSSYSTTTEFTTISLTPLVKIKQTVDVTETKATFYGAVNPNSLSTSFYFEYGPTPALGLVTPTYLLPDTTEFLNVSASVTDLQPRQTYYYKLVATNGFASSETDAVHFFTAVKPVISSYIPATAPIGAEVTITGQNFNLIPEKNLVSFGATRATILSSSSTEIKVKVPAGASFGPISLLDAESGLSAESVQEFVPTFTGEFEKGNLQQTIGINDPHIYRALVQDIDGDHKPDIVASHARGFSVFQNVNQGGDITEESFIRNTYPSEYNSGDIHVVDFDGNGLKDVVVRYQNGLRIYPNFSVPGFVFFEVPVELPVGSLSDMVFNDFDQDGRLDIAGLSSSTVITIFRNQNPMGSLSINNFEKGYVKILPYYIEYLTSGDLNNDGTPDLMVGPYNKDFFSIFKNTSHPGAFEFEENSITDSNRGRFAQYAASDLNQDGWKDITSLSRTPYETYQTTSLTILKNNSNSPNITLAQPVSVLSGSNESIIQPGDVDGDGKVDLLVGLSNRKFIFLKNKTIPGESLSGSSFENFEDYGHAISNTGSGTAEPKMVINDLNGDGRPEVIKTNSYSYGPRDGYLMEIWQNAPLNCLDPSLVSVNPSNYSAIIVLPPNTTLDQFEIDYTLAGNDYWDKVYSTTLSLWAGYSYKLRVRAKCYLSFTEYHYINFTTDCVDTNEFSISNIGINSVNFEPYDLSSFEIEYSLAGKNQWVTLPEYANQITNLLPGTAYDLRYKGRWCSSVTEFRYKQFTTLCPQLSTLNITEIFYNKATVNWTSNYTGNAILEYSADNVTWALIDETRTMFSLLPARQYFVRASLRCTDAISDFIYTSFTTPCPNVSLYVDTVTPFSARINWIDESDADSYTLRYSMSGGGAIKTVETSSTFFTLDGLYPGTQYTVAVAPQCTASKDFTSITFSTVCYAPFNLSIDAITHTTAELSWSDNFSGVPYSIDYSISGSNLWLTTETALTNISLNKLRQGTEYEARVHINCLSETAPYVSLFFETSLYQETALAPNPTNNKVTIYPSKNLIGNHFIIHDNAGRIVVDGELRDYTIDLSDFSTGIYTLKIDGESPMKIVKH